MTNYGGDDSFDEEINQRQEAIDAGKEEQRSIERIYYRKINEMEQ